VLLKKELLKYIKQKLKVDIGFQKKIYIWKIYFVLQFIFKNYQNLLVK